MGISDGRNGGIECEVVSQATGWGMQWGWILDGVGGGGGVVGSVRPRAEPGQGLARM